MTARERTAADPPASIMTVLDVAIDSLLGGSSGFLHIPAGGYLACDWLSRKRVFRLTIDVTPNHPLDDAAVAFTAELRGRLAKLLERVPAGYGQPDEAAT